MVRLVYVKPIHLRHCTTRVGGRSDLLHRHKWTTRPELNRVACLYLCLVCHASLLCACRCQGDGRRTVEQTRVIEIGTVRRAGYVGRPAVNWWKWREKAYQAGFRPSHWKDGRIELPNQVLHTVQVAWRFGGKRFYFLCECGRRVEKLHAVRDWPWRCRHCYRLTYATRQAVPRHRYVMKAQKIRRQLGGSLNMVEAFPPKPKGMHWKRYELLRRKYARAEAQVLGRTSAYLSWLRGAHRAGR